MGELWRVMDLDIFLNCGIRFADQILVCGQNRLALTAPAD